MEAKNISMEDFKNYIDGEDLRNFDIDTNELDNYIKKLKDNMVKSRHLIEIDQIEARALKNRTCRL